MRKGEAKLGTDPSTMIHTIVNIRVFLPRTDYSKMKTVSVSLGDAEGQEHLENLMNEFLNIYKHVLNNCYISCF